MEKPHSGLLPLRSNANSPNDLSIAAASGTLPIGLWCFLRAWSQLHDADIQFLEGLNSKVKIASSRAQRMSLDTLSNRMRVQYALPDHDCSCSWKMKCGRELVEKMAIGDASCVDSTLQDRWASPSASLHLPSKAACSEAVHRAVPGAQPTLAMTWAARFALMFNRRFKHPSVEVCLTFKPAKASRKAYLLVDKSNRDKAWANSMMTPCIVHEDKNFVKQIMIKI